MWTSILRPTLTAQQAKYAGSVCGIRESTEGHVSSSNSSLPMMCSSEELVSWSYENLCTLRDTVYLGWKNHMPDAPSICRTLAFRTSTSPATNKPCRPAPKPASILPALTSDPRLFIKEGSCCEKSLQWDKKEGGVTNIIGYHTQL